MALQIHGIGTAVPKYCYNTDLDILMAKEVLKPTPEQASWLPEIYSNSTIVRRFNSLSEEDFKRLLQRPNSDENPDWRGPSIAERMKYFQRDAFPIAIASAERALKKAGWSPKEISSLITVSCTGIATPGIDLALLDGLDLSKSVGKIHIGSMGCQAAINAFRVANALARDPNEKILICAVELCSLHYYCSWQPNHVIANSLFGDGAASVVCKNHFSTNPCNKFDWKLKAITSNIIPNTKHLMGWMVGNHGFEITLDKKVPALIRTHLKPWIDDWLKINGMNLNSIGSWAVHPGGPKILDAVQESLQIDENSLDHSRSILKNYGNMSSPSVLFIAEEMMKSQAKMPCLMLGFGPGIAIEAALWDYE